MSRQIILVDFENVQPASLGALDAERHEVKLFAGQHQKKVDLALARALQALGPRAEYIQIAGSGKDALDFHIAFYIGRLSQSYPDAHFTIVSRDTGFDPLVKHLASLGITCTRVATIGGGSVPTPIPPQTPARPATKVVAKAPARAPARAPVKSPIKAPARVQTKATAKVPAKVAQAVPAKAPAKSPVNKMQSNPIAKSATATKPAPNSASTKPVAKKSMVPARQSAADTMLAARVARATTWLAKMAKNRPGTYKALRASIGNLFKPALAAAELDAVLVQLAASGRVRIDGARVAYPADI